MKGNRSSTHVIELDGELYRMDGGTVSAIEDLREISGDKWLATDFQEGLSRVMTVEGPVKYAELLVRRKLQESGEFEEPVSIFTHWKKKRGKNTTDIFFTAVPSRLAQYYQDELGRQEDIILVFGVYGVLWNMVTRAGGKEPLAVVFRHHRFAEVLVASRDQVYFANRCVAFDTEKEQIDALWSTVQSDIETVEQERRIGVNRIICLNWLHAEEIPPWPNEWQHRLVVAEQTDCVVDDRLHVVSWPFAVQRQSTGRSVSLLSEKLFYFAKSWAPALNMLLVLLTTALVIGAVGYRGRAYQLQRRINDTQQQIGEIKMDLPKETLDQDFDSLLKFLGELDRNRQAPSYQQIVDDLTLMPFDALALHRLKVEFGSNQVRLELAGRIGASFDRAHGGYQAFLNKLTSLGYRIEESRFETRISESQVMLKLSRPVT